MSISYSEALENNVITQNTYDILPRKCLCGHDLELDEAIRNTKCTNPECNVSLINRLYSFSKKLNLELSVSDILVLIEELKIISPYQLLLLDKAYANGSITEDTIFNVKEIVESVKNVDRQRYLYQIIELCGIDDISNVAKALAFGFNTIDEFYDEVNRGQLSFINDRLGVYDTDICILSYKIYCELLDIKEELIFAETLFKVKQFNNRITVAFNDLAGDFLNKHEFIDYLNYKFKSHTFVQLESISDKLDILVKNSHLTSAKFKTARLINDKYVARAVNSGSLQLSDVGKDVPGDLKPLGYRIYIDTIENVVSKLKKLEG